MSNAVYVADIEHVRRFRWHWTVYLRLHHNGRIHQTFVDGGYRCTEGTARHAATRAIKRYQDAARKDLTKDPREET